VQRIRRTQAVAIPFTVSGGALIPRDSLLADLSTEALLKAEASAKAGAGLDLAGHP
jgi:hypothetical protein